MPQEPSYGVVPKATALALRKSPRGTELLVFDHPFDGGVISAQLPAGTIEAGEAPQHAARRELTEETGIEASVTGLAGILDEFVRGERRRRWVYVMSPLSKVKDRWPYLCSCGAPVVCRWEPLETAKVNGLQVNWVQLGREWVTRNGW